MFSSMFVFVSNFLVRGSHSRVMLYSRFIKYQHCHPPYCGLVTLLCTVVWPSHQARYFSMIGSTQTQVSTHKWWIFNLYVELLKISRVLVKDVIWRPLFSLTLLQEGMCVMFYSGTWTYQHVPFDHFAYRCHTSMEIWCSIRSLLFSYHLFLNLLHYLEDQPLEAKLLVEYQFLICEYVKLTTLGQS